MPSVLASSPYTHTPESISPALQADWDFLPSRSECSGFPHIIQLGATDEHQLESRRRNRAVIAGIAAVHGLTNSRWRIPLGLRSV